MKRIIKPAMSYSSLNIIQRINVKANARAYGERFGTLVPNFMAIKQIAAMDLHHHRYDTPFYFTGSNPLY